MAARPCLLALVLLSVLGPPTSASAQVDACLSVSVDSDQDFVAVVQSAFHLRYGCLYPMTYRFRLPAASSGLSVARRHSCLESWQALPEKQSTDYFNGIEVVRFDYPAGFAHVSAALAGGSDSLFLRMTDSTGTPVNPDYQGIDPYYDDRRAAVTITADDWCDNQNARFCATLSLFRSYGLYVTAGVITGPSWCSAPTWAAIQAEADSGYVELASHSRSHTPAHYRDPVGEVQGSAADIVSHVQLPPLFSTHDRGYVYAWIAPLGQYDATVDSLLGAGGYLVPRLYDPRHAYGLSSWDVVERHFEAIQPTIEIGAPTWGGGCTDSSCLNSVFDCAVDAGGVYHLMWHPQAVGFDLDQPYLQSHLQHISGRTDVWYANLGHVYLYHLIQMASLTAPPPASCGVERAALRLRPSTPNPLRTATTLRFDLSQPTFITLAMFDVLGEKVATLLSATMEPGTHEVTWNARPFPTGIYFCRLGGSTPDGRTFTATQKVLVLK